MNTATAARRELRDGSPEQLEAMLHVAREAADLATLQQHDDGEDDCHIVDASAALLWLTALGMFGLAAWCIYSVCEWLAPHMLALPLRWMP